MKKFNVKQQEIIVDDADFDAYIRVDYRRKHLGYFNTLNDAAEAYRRGALKFHKEFARVS